MSKPNRGFRDSISISAALPLGSAGQCSVPPTPLPPVSEDDDGAGFTPPSSCSGPYAFGSFSAASSGSLPFEPFCFWPAERNAGMHSGNMLLGAD